MALPSSPHDNATPFLTEVVDPSTGLIRASGELSPQGADLLHGTVQSLWRQGHSQVVLDLADVLDDATSRSLVHSLRASLAASEGELLIRRGART